MPRLPPPFLSCFLLSLLDGWCGFLRASHFFAFVAAPIFSPRQHVPESSFFHLRRNKAAKGGEKKRSAHNARAKHRKSLKKTFVVLYPEVVWHDVLFLLSKRACVVNCKSVVQFVTTAVWALGLSAVVLRKERKRHSL